MSTDAQGRSVVDVTLGDAVAEYRKYSGWPELKESFMAGKVEAAYLLAPMVMDLADRGVPAKIVALGHRSGAVIMVRSDSPFKSVVLTNDDSAVHYVGPIVLASRQTYRIPFRRPGRFQYACSLHAAGRLTIVVTPEPPMGFERLRWRLAHAWAP